MWMEDHRRDENVAWVPIGSFQSRKKGVSRFDLRDPHHLEVALSWPQFLAALLALYVGECRFRHAVLVSSGFSGERSSGQLRGGLLQYWDGGGGRLWRDVSGDAYGHVVASIEIVCGLAFTAILTGLTFVRFSRTRRLG